MKEGTSVWINRIAGILFALLAVLRFNALSLQSILSSIGCLVLCFAAFFNIKKALPTIGFLLMNFLVFTNNLTNFFASWYDLVDFTYSQPLEVLFSLLLVAINLSLCPIFCAFTISLSSKGSSTAQRLWMIPVVLQLLATITSIINICSYPSGSIPSSSLFTYWLRTLLTVPAVYFTFKWLATSSIVNEVNTESGSFQPAQTWEEKYYCNLVLHTALVIFTFGIWECVWMYRTTKFLNNTHKVPWRGPVVQFVLHVFVPFYYLYWVYTTAKRLDTVAQSKATYSNTAFACLLLEIFFPVISLIVMQNTINKIAAAAINFPGNTDSDTTLNRSAF